MSMYYTHMNEQAHTLSIKSAAATQATALERFLRKWLFWSLHLIPLSLFWLDTQWWHWAVCIGLYFGRMFFISAAYHRYFSHKTFKTSRWFQFVLAFMAQTSAQKGALWWAAHHRLHHKYSDTDLDPHSPARKGIWYAHYGWIYDPKNAPTHYEHIPDFAKYPELVWLNKFKLMPAVVLAVVLFLIGSWPLLVVGFFVSTILLWNGTFLINSAAHLIGKQRFVTGEDSKNSWLLAILCLGEGWHNNHHYKQFTTKFGFHWWEIDMTYIGLRILSWFGLVWDLKVLHEIPDPEIENPKMIARLKEKSA